MEIKTYEELTTPDPRTLAFTPLGLSTMGLLKPENAAEFQQQVIAHCDLADEVTEGTKNSFERLRTLHTYGVLCYEAYTVAQDLAWLLLEQALRERFLEFYNHVVPLVNAKTGNQMPLPANDFSVVDDAFRRDGSHAKGKWTLPLTNGSTMEFSGSMGQLQEWARKERLLDGQRNKRLDPVYRAMRNDVAHPHYHLIMPVDSARTIRDLAEIINRLWGHTTPGGRLYPAPLERDVLIVAWTGEEQGVTHTLLRDYQLEWFTEPGDWNCVIVRGVFEDEGVWEFDAQYERTIFPVELLCGPGSRKEAVAWLREAAPEHDTVSYLDRLFAVRIHEGRASIPRRPEVALALPPERQVGRWLLVRADFPIDAFVHGRHLKDGITCGGSVVEHIDRQASGDASLPSCALEELFDGDWNGLVDMLSELGITDPAPLLHVRVPPRFAMDVAPDVEAD
jgi:hypothetical protein